MTSLDADVMFSLMIIDNLAFRCMLHQISSQNSTKMLENVLIGIYFMVKIVLANDEFHYLMFFSHSII